MKTTQEMSSYQRKRRYYIAFSLLIFSFLMIFVNSSWHIFYHEQIEVIGLCFIGIGIVGRLWCTLYIGGHKNADIIQLGPYSIMRNPLYFFSTIAAFGAGAQSGSLIIGFIAALCCYLIFMRVILVEENFLKQKFGEKYLKYYHRVPRFFPNFNLYSEKLELHINLKFLYATLIDGVVFLAAYPIFELVEYLQNIHVLPVLFSLY